MGILIYLCFLTNWDIEYFGLNVLFILLSFLIVNFLYHLFFDHVLDSDYNEASKEMLVLSTIINNR
jgi:hypothetical protein